MKALLLGSIGVLAETSDIQRASYNTAFEEAGLEWHWSREHYARLLEQSGGQDRIAAYADTRGDSVDVAALHARKSALFQDRLAAGVSLRPGVADTMAAARQAGHALALVTTTSPQNVAAILAATGLDRDRFDVVLDGTAVQASKPDPEAYHVAMDRLGAQAAECLAVEDNPDGLRAARAAGVACIAFPGTYHDPAGFDGAREIMQTLTLPQTPQAT